MQYNTQTVLISDSLLAGLVKLQCNNGVRWLAYQRHLSKTEIKKALILKICASLKTVPDNKVRGPTWGPSGVDSTQVGPMLAPWTLLSGVA